MTLDEILDAARAESAEREKKHPLDALKRKVAKMSPTRGFARALARQPFSVIAEIKRKSPSMGQMNARAIATAYEVYHQHPLVSAISVLTQHSHFGGSIEDLEIVRRLTQRRPKPILRKDFIFLDYEIYFSRAVGADAILLMANVVDDKAEFKRLHDLAISIGLDVLCEVHDQSEIDILPDTARICGINSRRFKGVKLRKSGWKVLDIVTAPKPAPDTQTDLTAFDLVDHLPANSIKVAESGVSSDNIEEVLSRCHFNAVLIGTSLLRSGREEMIECLDRIQSAAQQPTGAPVFVG